MRPDLPPRDGMTVATTTAPLAILPICENDLAAVAELEARAYGPGRFARTAYRVREGTSPLSPYARLLRKDGTLKGAIRFTPVTIGGTRGALLLGPVTVEPGLEGKGLGRLLITEGVAAAERGTVDLVVLIGDEPYYGRHGFEHVPTGQITFPGPVDPARILARPLVPGALARYTGQVTAERLTAGGKA